MLRGVAVLDSHGTLRQQARLMGRYHPHRIHITPPARSYRYFLPRRDLPGLMAQLAPAAQRVVLLGPGDFHHLTAALVGALRAQGPFALVVLDAHPEWSPAPVQYLHCGSWLPEVLHLPHVQAAVLVGVGPLESQGLLAPPIIQALAAPAREGRLRIYPARRATVRELHRALRWPDPLASLEDGLEQVIQDILAFLNGSPVYLSVDKDVVRPEELPGTWGGGGMTTGEVVTVVGAVAARLPVVGADLCGEYVPPLPLGLDDPGVRSHEAVNLRLIDVLLEGTLPPQSARAA